MEAIRLACPSPNPIPDVSDFEFQDSGGVCLLSINYAGVVRYPPGTAITVETDPQTGMVLATPRQQGK